MKFVKKNIISFLSFVDFFEKMCYNEEEGVRIAVRTLKAHLLIFERYYYQQDKQ